MWRWGFAHSNAGSHQRAILTLLVPYLFAGMSKVRTVCCSLWKMGLSCCAADEVFLEMLQVLCSFAFHFLSAIHCKLEKMWRILVVVPEGVMICSIIFSQLLRECSVYAQKKLWLQNFFTYASASLQMKVPFEKILSVPKIKITLTQQRGVLYFLFI